MPVGTTLDCLAFLSPTGIFKNGLHGARVSERGSCVPLALQHLGICLGNCQPRRLPRDQPCSYCLHLSFGSMSSFRRQLRELRSRVGWRNMRRIGQCTWTPRC
jgi:hypothetical protein